MATIKSETNLELLKVVLFCIIFGSLCALLSCPSCISEPKLMLQVMAASIVVWLIMWLGNSFVSGVIDHYFTWLENPVKRLIFGVLGHVLYTLLASVAIVYGIEFFFPVRIGNIWITILISVGIALLISLILHSRQFLISWRSLAIESEKIKKEAITSKYETLKNQVNPHFLFNSLNALTNLVYEDQDMAAKFIKKLSDVYRYVLESRDKELVPFDTELEFVRSYIFLQKIRYEEQLQVEISIPPQTGSYLVPLSLQMLAENAIKHNEISEENPLKIYIYKEDNFIVMKNNLQKKNILDGDSSKVGLANIQARFAFLTNYPVVVQQGQTEFIVKLPLVKTKRNRE